MSNGRPDLECELRKTQPDYVVYVPRRLEGAGADTGNEHFLVFDAPDGSLMAVWTQSTREGAPDQRIVFSRSTDGGRTWRAPRTIAGADVDPQTRRGMASWGFPMVSRSGRIYVLYSLHTGVDDVFRHTTGLMAGRYSDDLGETWSEQEIVQMPRTRWDNPDPETPANWIVWQKPLRLGPDGCYLAGFTRWVSPAVRPPAPIRVWWAEASVVQFMTFVNLDDDPAVKDLAVEYTPADYALTAPLVDHPTTPVIQEPSIVPLPDGRLFCCMRATTGSPWFSISTDRGRSWTVPEPLRRTDGGSLIPHPCSPCPLYEVGPGEYVLFVHNHDGHFEKWGPRDTTWHRRPIYILRGQYRAGARQPIWFSEPEFFMDNGGAPLGAGPGRTDLALYASMTFENGTPVLWYPERKFFLLGRRIPRDLLDRLPVP